MPDAKEKPEFDALGWCRYIWDRTRPWDIQTKATPRPRRSRSVAADCAHPSRRRPPIAWPIGLTWTSERNPRSPT